MNFSQQSWKQVFCILQLFPKWFMVMGFVSSVIHTLESLAYTWTAALAYSLVNENFPIRALAWLEVQGACSSEKKY